METTGEQQNYEQGDMVMGNDAMTSTVSALGASFSAGTVWSQARLKYCFASDTSDAVKQQVRKACDRFGEAVPGLECVDVGLLQDSDDYKTQRCQQKTAVYITSKNSGCWAHVGMLHTNSQSLNLQSEQSPRCTGIGTVMHELLHSLGQGHEQSRGDRDAYVTIMKSNIKDGRGHNFEKITKAGVAWSQFDYDISSIMHYEAGAFAKKDGMPTITAKPKAYELYTQDPDEFDDYPMGNRVGMTQMDANQLAAMYNLRANELEPLRDAKCTNVAWSKDKCDLYYRNYCTMQCNPSSDGTSKCKECSKKYSNYYFRRNCCNIGGGVRIQKWKSPGRPTCSQSCYRNVGEPWTTKCSTSGCAGCEPCKKTPVPSGACKGECSATPGSQWPNVCRTKACSECDQCAGMRGDSDAAAGTIETADFKLVMTENALL